jgi:signal transduction histidine kinase
VKSLRVRLLVLAGAVVAVALLATGIAITQLFILHLERRVGQELDTHLSQLAGGLRLDADDVISISRDPADPRFGRVFGGLYWQVRDELSDTVLRSRSLWDADLGLADDGIEPGALHVHETVGPDGSSLLVHEQVIIVVGTSGERRIRTAVAIDRASITELEDGFARDTMVALLLLGAVLLAGFAIQVSAGLKPLRTLQERLGLVRTGKAERIDWSGAREIEPLVEEVNSLLERQRDEIVRARDRAADLAHGLKTPLTTMAADIRRLRAAGQTEVADDLDMVAVQMERHVDRELARARIRRGGYMRPVPVAGIAGTVIRSIARTPDGERVAISLDMPDDVAFQMDIVDATELLGNLIENACRHAKGAVRISAHRAGTVSLTVEDDGQGMPDSALAEIPSRGRLLDMGPSGSAGLGLAIVSDIVTAYGGTLTLGRSELGGLLAAVTIPGGDGDPRPT